MKSVRYEIDQKDLKWRSLMGPLDRAGEALSRLDERLRESPIADGVIERCHFHEGAATLLIAGEFVQMEDLVLFDAGLLSRVPTSEINWARDVVRARRQLARMKTNQILTEDGLRDLMGQRAASRGRSLDRSPLLYDLNYDQDALLENWHEVLAETERFPALIAAAIAWDAWAELEPVQHQGWRASLLAAAILKARGKTRHHLAAINWGAKAAKFRRNEFVTPTERLAGFLEWVEESANHAYKDFNRLSLAHEIMSIKLKSKRKNSRLQDLIDLLVSRPLITIPMASAKLKISVPGIHKMMADLGGTPRELTGRTKYRAFGIV